MQYHPTDPKLTHLNKRLYTFEDLAAAVVAEQVTEAAKDANPTPANLSAWASVMRAAKKVRDARQRAAAQEAGMR